MKGYDVLRFDDLYKDGKKLSITLNITMQEVADCLLTLEAECGKPEANFGVLKDICSELLRSLSLPVSFYPCNFFLRCRPNNSDEQHFTSIKEISYNPNCSPGRFNLVQDPVLYGALPYSSHQADGSITAMVEACKSLFDDNFPFDHKYFTISRWKVVKSFPVVMLGFHGTTLQNSPHLRNMIAPAIEFMIQTMNEEDNMKCKRFYDYFSEKAAKRFDRINQYLLTTAFYHALKERQGGDVGILYSSSMTENNGLNVVISKKLVDEGYVTPDHVVMFKAQRNPSNPYQYSILPCSNGAIPNSNGEFKLIKSF